MKKVYVYTELAEKRAKEVRSLLKGREAGKRAMFAGEPIEETPTIKRAWLEKGFIREETKTCIRHI